MRALILALATSLVLLQPAPARGRTARGDASRWPELPARGGEGWPAAQREEFQAFCRSHEPEPFCACWLGLLEERYPSLEAFYRDLAKRRRDPLGHHTDRCLLRHGRRG